MCPTPVGRVHTRTSILVGPAILGAILWLITGREDFLVLIGIYLLMGVALDTCVYSLILRYQPPWMTFVLGLAEFGLLYVIANLVELQLSTAEAIIFYWVSWVMAAWTKVVILPIASLTYIESSTEFREAAWSIPPAQAAVPVLAAAGAQPQGGGELIRSASGAHAVPLERLPSPSGVHAVPAGAPGQSA